MMIRNALFVGIGSSVCAHISIFNIQYSWPRNAKISDQHGQCVVRRAPFQSQNQCYGVQEEGPGGCFDEPGTAPDEAKYFPPFTSMQSTLWQR
jgi:hypothetical protein